MTDAMTPDEEAAVQAAIVETTIRIRDITNDHPVGVVMSALLSCIVSGAAGTPCARPMVLESMRSACAAVAAMGELQGNDAMQAAVVAAGGALTQDDALDAPSSTLH